MKKALSLFLTASSLLLSQTSHATYWREANKLTPENQQIADLLETQMNKNADLTEIESRSLVGVYRRVSLSGPQLKSQFGIESQQEVYTKDDRLEEYSQDLAVIEKDGKLNVQITRTGANYREPVSEDGGTNATIFMKDLLNGLNADQKLAVDHDSAQYKNILGDCVAAPYRIVDVASWAASARAISICSNGRVLQKTVEAKRTDDNAAFELRYVGAQTSFYVKIKMHTWMPFCTTLEELAIP